MQSFRSIHMIHAAVSEKKIFEKVYVGRQTTDDGRRRTQSDDKSSLCLWQGEQKIVEDRKSLYLI